MTTATLDRAERARPALAVAPVEASASTGVDLPADFDSQRVYLAAPTVTPLPRYSFPAGPPTPFPNRVTLVDRVRACVEGREG